MKRNHRPGRVVLLVALALTMGGCEVVTKQRVGAGLGGIAGGLAGSLFGSGSGQLVATALGSFTGGLIGSEIGGRLDRADQTKSDVVSFQALEYALRGATWTVLITAWCFFGVFIYRNRMFKESTQ